MLDRTERRNNYARYTSRWYVRNPVRIVFQGGNHSKKQFIFYFTSSLETRGDQQSILQCGDPQL